MGDWRGKREGEKTEKKIREKKERKTYKEHNTKASEHIRFSDGKSQQEKEEKRKKTTVRKLLVFCLLPAHYLSFSFFLVLRKRDR